MSARNEPSSVGNTEAALAVEDHTLIDSFTENAASAVANHLVYTQIFTLLSI